VELSITSYKNHNNQIEIVAIIRRIDKRKENELHLQKKQTEMQKLQDTRDSFFGIIGNEIKNPISAIINTSNLLKEHLEKMDELSVKKNLRSISNSADHLYKLFDNLLQ
jgi:K+-sensing histidine kinase KdpD